MTNRSKPPKDCHAAGQCSSSLSAGQTAFHLHFISFQEDDHKKNLGYDICRRSTRLGIEVERCKESRQRSPEMEEPRRPIFQRKLEEQILSKSATLQLRGMCKVTTYSECTGSRPADSVWTYWVPDKTVRRTARPFAHTTCSRYTTTNHTPAAWTKQDAVGDGRLRPRCRHLANSTKHTCRL